VDNPIRIDLHCRILERLPLTETEISDLIFPPQPVPGSNAYPSMAALFLHVIAHATGSMVHRGVRLLQLIDIARLAGRMTEADWSELLRVGECDRRLWWGSAPLLLTTRYFPHAIPAGVLDGLVRDCPRLLRMAMKRRDLSDLSYSHAFIDPLPGIVWTRSLGEMVRYVASRVRPTQEKLDQLELLAQTYPWAHDPCWYRQSQARRIVGWLAQRPTRVETMQTVRAALGHSR
jgi:hypothetical protein